MGLYKIVVFGFGDFWALFFSSNENGEGNQIDSYEDQERNMSCIDSWSCTHTGCVQLVGDDFGLTSITHL